MGRRIPGPSQERPQRRLLIGECNVRASTQALAQICWFLVTTQIDVTLLPLAPRRQRRHEGRSAVMGKHLPYGCLRA